MKLTIIHFSGNGTWISGSISAKWLTVSGALRWKPSFYALAEEILHTRLAERLADQFESDAEIEHLNASGAIDEHNLTFG